MDSSNAYQLGAKIEFDPKSEGKSPITVDLTRIKIKEGDLEQLT
jgi:hypothetical protein